MSADNAVDIVIMTALPLERDAVLRYLDGATRVESKNRVVHKAFLPHKSSTHKSGTQNSTNHAQDYHIVLVCLAGMGNVRAATVVTQAIDVWHPDTVILVGIMGGIADDSRSLGDIIVPDQIVGYELGKVKETGTEIRYDVFRATPHLVGKAQAFPQSQWVHDTRILARPDSQIHAEIHAETPAIHVGPIASGEKVIADLTTIPALQAAWPKLMGVEMEGLGTALAASEAASAPAMLMVKSICDWADPHKNDAWQPYAADVAAAYTVHFLASAPIESHDKEKILPKVDRVDSALSGKTKYMVCRRLGADWRDLADYFDIPPYQQARFQQGYECQGIWVWLEERQRLYALNDALRFIEREDLARLLEEI
ncbi:MAG: hypothetical protein AAF639_38050 [Chloroflexota bacterium]